MPKELGDMAFTPSARRGPTIARVVAVCLLLLSGVAGCRRPARPVQPAADPAEQAAQAEVRALLERVRQAEAQWRKGVSERRRLREHIMSLPGRVGVGLVQKDIPHLAQQAGLRDIEVHPKPSFERGVMLRVHPQLVAADGSWNQVVSFLSRIERSAPKIGLLDYALTRRSRGATALADEVRVEALVAVFGRDRLPPAAAPPPPAGPVPLNPARARMALTDRLLLVEAAAASGRREARHLRVALDRIEAACVPARALFAGLRPIPQGVRLSLVTAGRGRALVGGEASQDALVQQFADRLTREHPLLHEGTIVQRARETAPGGWRSTFRLAFLLGEERPAREAPRPAGVPTVAPASAPPAMGEVVAPPPAPVVVPSASSPEPAGPTSGSRPTAPSLPPQPAGDELVAPPPAPVVPVP